MPSEFQNAYNEAIFDVQDLFRNLTQQEVNKFLLALLAILRTADKPVDRVHFSLHLEAAREMGMFDKDEFAALIRRQAEFKSPPIEDAKEIVRRLKDLGGSALKTGHYRRLTLPQIKELIQAGRAATYTVLLIESGQRTSDFKFKENELTDDQRIRMFEMSGLITGGVYLIKGGKYDNKFYTSLLTEWSPAFYLGNESWPEWLKLEARERAKKAGSIFVELGKYLPDISTTGMEGMIFGK